MEDQTASIKYMCNEPACPVKINGMCLEGLSLSECQHNVLLSDLSSPLLPELYSNNSVNELPLFLGEELSDEEINTITLAYPTKLILIMGETASGKTTLLGSIFDQFQKGPIAGLNFAGSRTQIGFERRCHLARYNFKNKIAETERTKSTEFSYLHLSTRSIDSDADIKHLLFTDVAGERFRMVRDSETEMSRFTILKQADKVFYVVDGDQITKSNSRHAVKQNLIKLFDRLLVSALLSVDVGVYLLITKWDIVKSRSKEEVIKSFLLDPIENRFGDFIKGYYSICARAFDDPDIESGLGLDNFLHKCLEDPSNLKNFMDIEVSSKTNREIDRFAVR